MEATHLHSQHSSNNNNDNNNGNSPNSHPHASPPISHTHTHTHTQRTRPHTHTQPRSAQGALTREGKRLEKEKGTGESFSRVFHPSKAPNGSEWPFHPCNLQIDSCKFCKLKIAPCVDVVPKLNKRLSLPLAPFSLPLAPFSLPLAPSLCLVGFISSFSP